MFCQPHRPEMPLGDLRSLSVDFVRLTSFGSESQDITLQIAVTRRDPDKHMSVWEATSLIKLRSRSQNALMAM